MKTIILFGLLLSSSCATVSEYNQGCRDGIGLTAPINSTDRQELCNILERAHQLEKKEVR